MQPGSDTITTGPAAGVEPGAGSALASVRTQEKRSEPRLKSPALFLAIAFALGLAATGRSQESLFALTRSIPALIAFSAACLLAGTLLVRCGREVFAAGAAIVGFALAGAAAASLFSFRFPPHHLSNLKSWGMNLNRPLNLEGMLVSDPIRSPSGIEFDVEAVSLDQAPDGREGPKRLVTGRVRVIVAYGGTAISSAMDLRSSDRVEAIMRLRQPRVYRNPGSFDFRGRAQSIDDLYWEGSIDDENQLHKLPAPSRASWRRFIESVRGRLRGGIDRLYPPWSREGRDGAVIKAILLGDRSSLDSTTVDNFRASGLYHLLVIAGLHVGLIAALILGFCRFLGLRRSARNLCLLAILLAYSFVVEQRAPTLRASLMLVAFVLAELLGRDHTAINAVGIAALILLVTRPAWLFESGFQLSFGAALLIVGLAAPLLRATIEPYRNSLRELWNIERDAALLPLQAQFRLDLRLLISALQRRSTMLDGHTEAASQVVIWPLQAAFWLAEIVLFSALLQIGLLLPMVEQFHRVALAGVGLNAAALPLMGLLLAVAIPTVILAVWLPAWAVWPAKAASTLLRLLFALAARPHLPGWLSYRAPSPPLLVAVGFAVSLIVLALTLGRIRTGLLASSLAFGIFAILLVCAPFAPRIPVDTFELTALDCGRGEATLMVLPGAFTVLVGAGGAGRAGPPAFARAQRWDAGENIVSPYLWSRGIKHLGVVVVASAGGNLDGFVSILQNFRVDEIWYPQDLATRDSAADGMQAIFDAAHKRGTRIRELAAGEVLKLGTAEFQIGSAASTAQNQTQPSGQPFVMRVASPNGSALLAMGNCTSTQGALALAKLESTALVIDRQALTWVAHSSLLENISPKLAIVAPGSSTHGTAGDSLVVSAPELAAAQIVETDVAGAATIEMKSSSFVVRTFLAGREKLP